MPKSDHCLLCHDRYASAPATVMAASGENVQLEIACFSANDAIVAWRGGADRIELCANRSAGGTTPSVDTFVQVKQKVDIPVLVMIRARGGDDFCYSTTEFSQMQADLLRFKQLGVDGFVLGVLDARRHVDIQRTATLVDLALPLPCTFHRAIDHTPDLDAALEAIISTGCAAVLSSGGATDALTGIQKLSRLTLRAATSVTAPLTIIVGGGVRARNVLELRKATRATIYHSSGVADGATVAELDEIQRMKTLLRDNASKSF